MEYTDGDSDFSGNSKRRSTTREFSTIFVKLIENGNETKANLYFNLGTAKDGLPQSKSPYHKGWRWLFQSQSSMFVFEYPYSSDL